MSSETAFLALMLDAPMQSWGFSSRFQRRTTGLHPTKSGIVGMISAAMGLAKRSPEEEDELVKLAKLAMTTVVIPRKRHNRWKSTEEPLFVLRLEDFHTTGGGYEKKTQPLSIPRKASGGPCDNPTVSHRQYLYDAKFGVILAGDKALLEKIADALRDPVWGIWFGRKNCIPAAPLLVGLRGAKEDAWKAILEKAEFDYRPIEEFTRIEESDFAGGNDTWSDGVPESFANMRPWPVRRISQSIGEK